MQQKNEHLLEDEYGRITLPEEEDIIPSCSDEVACEIVQKILEKPSTKINLTTGIMLEGITSIGTLSLSVSVPTCINRKVGIKVDLSPYCKEIMQEMSSLQSRLENILSPIKNQL